MLRATETGQSRPDDGHHGKPPFDTRNHFHPSRVDEVHEVLRRHLI
jgi:hypothetical protein